MTIRRNSSKRPSSVYSGDSFRASRPVRSDIQIEGRVSIAVPRGQAVLEFGTEKLVDLLDTYGQRYDNFDLWKDAELNRAQRPVFIRDFMDSPDTAAEFVENLLAALREMGVDLVYVKFPREGQTASENAFMDAGFTPLIETSRVILARGHI